jgi:hypothetical protein
VNVLQYFERVVIAAADIQGDNPPSLVADKPDELLASVPATADGGPASHDQLLAALDECERRGWLSLVKVFGAWTWGLTPVGLEAARTLRARTESETGPDVEPLPSERPKASMAGLTDFQAQLLQAAFDVFIQGAKWPTLQHLRRVVTGPRDIEQALDALSPTLVVIDRPIQDESTVKLTVAGVARCQGSQGITEAFIWLVRFLVTVEAAYQPPSPTQASYPRVTSEDATQAWTLNYPERSRRDLDMAFVLTDSDSRLWSRGKGITADGGWEMTIDSRIRAYASITTLDEYLAVVAVAGVPAKESSLSGGQAPLPEIAYAGVVAGFSPDGPWGNDDLGFEAEVNAFTDLLLSRQVAPPMCVGLFGAWGSGKSFFMRQLVVRAGAVSQAARDASADDPLKAFCESVVHVRFNAWHYAEANLYASLAATILSELAAVLSQLGGAHEADRGKLMAVLKSAQESAAIASARADAAKSTRDQAAKDVQSARRDAVAAQLDLLKRTLEQFGDADPSARSATSLLSSTLGVSEKSLRLGDVSGLATASGSIIAFVLLVRRIGWRSMRRVLWGSLWPIGLAVILLAAVFWMDRQVAALASAPAVLIAALACLGLAKGLQADVVRAARLLMERERVEGSQSESAAALRQAESDLRAAQQAVDASQVELHRLTDAEAGSMYRFVLDRYAEADYQKQLGLVSRLHSDFAALSELLAKPTRESGLPRVERIVLYIDDLDRCPADTVLAVLQAVNLLLALPLFVVVIGVDARWLYSCIEQSGRSGEESPHRYVEKIIQIPFWLRRMDSDSYQRLISSAVAEQAESVVASVFPPGVNSGPLPEDGPVAERQTWPQSVRASSAMTRAEIDMLQRLVAFVPTPRAGKRLVNVYRLLRALIGPAARARLESGDYQTVLVQLALLSGFPEFGPVLFEMVRDANGADFWGLVEQWRRQTTNPNRSMPAAAAAAAGSQKGLVALQDALLALRDTAQLTTETFAAWSQITCRFSFTVPS